MDRALCAQIDPEIFFPETHGSKGGGMARRETLRQAEAICAKCTVRKECGELADLVNARDGVWAGKERGPLGDRANARAAS
jgi:WhiB family redox-sensing transcriptional regulator